MTPVTPMAPMAPVTPMALMTHTATYDTIWPHMTPYGPFDPL